MTNDLNSNMSVTLMMGDDHDYNVSLSMIATIMSSMILAIDSDHHNDHNKPNNTAENVFAEFQKGTWYVNGCLEYSGDWFGSFVID